MNADLEWTDYTTDGIKRKIRITFSGKKSIKWQFKCADESHWNYDRQPTCDEWAALEEKVESLYHRRRIKYEHLELIRKLRGSTA
jgi:hypothetical protein